MSKKLAVILVALCGVITVACIVTVVVVLMGKDSEAPPTISPDYAPKEEEPNAEPIPDDTEDKMEQPEGGGAVSLVYTTEVEVDLSEGKASLLFGNPHKSTQDMVLRVLIRDQVILQSGRITPGNQVTALELLPDAPTLGAGTYTEESCHFAVLYYDPVSGEKAMLNTVIPITVTVRE